MGRKVAAELLSSSGTLQVTPDCKGKKKKENEASSFHHFSRRPS